MGKVKPIRTGERCGGEGVGEGHAFGHIDPDHEISLWQAGDETKGCATISRVNLATLHVKSFGILVVGRYKGTLYKRYHHWLTRNQRRKRNSSFAVVRLARANNRTTTNLSDLYVGPLSFSSYFRTIKFGGIRVTDRVHQKSIVAYNL